MAVALAAVADDDTGATDLAGMLAEEGMRPVLLLHAADVARLGSLAADCDGVIVGTASRSIARDEAYRRTAEAVRALMSLAPRTILVKYCSTFDSTAEGNIGASIDAAMDVLGETFTVAMPAFPALGRTTYMGYHFVGDKLLSDSVLRNHPLNPMTNAHLASHLATQTNRRVGNVMYPDVRLGAQQIELGLRRERARGCGIAILDCVDDEQLLGIGRAVAEMPLITGSSAWGAVLPRTWREERRWAPTQGWALTRAHGGRGALVVNGSCSVASRMQVAWASANGFRVFRLDAPAAVRGEACEDESLVKEIAAALKANACCLLTTTPEDESGGSNRDGAAQREVGGIRAGLRISAALARVVHAVFERAVPEALIIGGGETASVLMRELRLGGLRVGRNIEPGVPVCVSLDRPALGVVLKSGNFGGEDFYRRAVEAVRALPQSE